MDNQSLNKRFIRDFGLNASTFSGNIITSTVISSINFTNLNDQSLVIKRIWVNLILQQSAGLELVVGIPRSHALWEISNISRRADVIAFYSGEEINLPYEKLGNTQIIGRLSSMGASTVVGSELANTYVNVFQADTYVVSQWRCWIEFEYVANTNY